VGGWLLLLCFILTVWNPATLALRLSAAAANLASETSLSIVSLAARLIMTSMGMAAGLALIRRRSSAVPFTKVVLVLFALEGAVRLSTRIDLSDNPPGTRLPMALLLIVHNAAWFFYLQKSRRVRTVYGLESGANP
jgi:hypothetical protein